MREFWKILMRYSAPYKSCLVWAVILNIFSAVFNIFSFTLIIPILNILFKIDTKVYEFIPWESAEPMKDKFLNNLYFYVGQWIGQYGASTTLLLLGLFLGVMTFLKTSCYFGSSAVMIPLRTGVVRDLRVQVYNKVIGLPMSFFSQQRKGDIIARMSGDVSQIEHTITSSLDMLLKNLKQSFMASLRTKIGAALVMPGLRGLKKKLSTSEYGGAVRFQVAVKKAEAEDFCAGLVDYMQGRVKIEKGDEYYAPFRE